MPLFVQLLLLLTESVFGVKNSSSIMSLRFSKLGISLRSPARSLVSISLKVDRDDVLFRTGSVSMFSENIIHLNFSHYLGQYCLTFLVTICLTAKSCSWRTSWYRSCRDAPACKLGYRSETQTPSDQCSLICFRSHQYYSPDQSFWS